jgi:hypothetical protein
VAEGQLFVEGDNPDPTASNDSHNFGMLRLESVIAIAD